MVEQLRRRLPRQEAHWIGKYTIEGGPSGVWGACEVLDISILGAGFELFEDPQHLFPTTEGDLVGNRVLVEVQTLAGASITLQMVGEIRYRTEGKRGGIRVGVQFSNLSDTEQQILNVLEQMQAVW
jgi:hypothetical protein